MVNAVTAAVRRTFRHSNDRAIAARLFGSPLVVASLPALSLALLASNTGYAQQAASKPEAAPEEIEEVTITGSRLSSVSGFNTPTPVTAVDSDQLAQMAAGPLVQALSTLPQFSGNQTQQNVGFPSSGGTNLNLRGAGANRTLVLLDGRRMTASNRYGLVDVATFPESLVKSVETVTGGASATYGSDAVTGVVNYILDTKYNGFKFKVDGGQTQYADGRNYSASLAGGMKIGERGHLLLSADIFRQDPIDSTESLKSRTYLKQFGRITETTPNAPSNSIEQYVEPTNFSNTGVLLFNSPAKGGPGYYEFGTNGSIAPEAFSGVGNQYSGCSCQATPTQTYGVNGNDQISPGMKRASLFMYFDYDIGDNTNVYAQALYGNSSTDSRSTGITLETSWTPNVYSGNPFLSSGAAALINQYGTVTSTDAGGIVNKGVPFGVYGAQDPNSPVGDDRTIQYDDSYTETLGFKTKLSFNGMLHFLDGWNWDGYAQHGEAIQDQRFVNGTQLAHVTNGLDAVRVSADGKTILTYNDRVNNPNAWAAGITECRAAFYNPSQFGSCQPADLFGGVDSLSDEAGQYITDKEKNNSSLVFQDVAETNLSGKVADGFGAGPITMALGLSFTRINFSQHVQDPTDEFVSLDDGTLSDYRGVVPCGTAGYPTTPASPTNTSGCLYGVMPGSVPTNYVGSNSSAVIQFTSLRVIDGGYSIKEAYGEMGIPLLENAFLARSLDLDIAGRFAHYTTSGGIWAYKAGLNWQMTDDLRFRGTYSHDIRAASLEERFDLTRGGAGGTDRFFGNLTFSGVGQSGGNPNLKPEQANTVTLGFVWQPSFIHGLQTSIDWYDIKIKDAIQQISVQNVIDQCYAATGGNLAAATALGGNTHNDDGSSPCSYIYRDPGTNVINRVDSLYVNLAGREVKGLDLEARYRTPITLFGGGAESLMGNIYGGWINTDSSTIPGGLPDNTVGAVVPRFKVSSGLSYTNGPINVFVQERWIANLLLDRTYVQSAVAIPGVSTISNNHIPATPYTDLNVNYDLSTAGHGWQFYGHITNLLNRNPPVVPGTVGRGGVGQTNSSLYDVVGRRFIVGAKFQF